MGNHVTQKNYIKSYEPYNTLKMNVVSFLFQNLMIPTPENKNVS